MNWNMLQNYTYNQTLVDYDINHSQLLQLKKEIQIIINGATQPNKSSQTIFALTISKTKNWVNRNYELRQDIYKLF